MLLSPGYYYQMFKSRLRKQQWWQLLSLLTKGYYGIIMFNKYCKIHTFNRWAVSCSQLHNATGVRLHLKILLFVHFISYMFFVFFWSVRTYVIHCLFYVIFFMRLFSFMLCIYFYCKYYYSWLYCSFNILFDHQIIVFS